MKWMHHVQHLGLHAGNLPASQGLPIFVSEYTALKTKQFGAVCLLHLFD